MLFFFFFQAEDGIRDLTVTGVQTCALPISVRNSGPQGPRRIRLSEASAPQAILEGSAGEFAPLELRVIESRSESRRSEEHTSELQSQSNLVCRLLLEKKKKTTTAPSTGKMRRTPFAIDEHTT